MGPRSIRRSEREAMNCGKSRVHPMIALRLKLAPTLRRYTIFLLHLVVCLRRGLGGSSCFLCNHSIASAVGRCSSTVYADEPNGHIAISRRRTARVTHWNVRPLLHAVRVNVQRVARALRSTMVLDRCTGRVCRRGRAAGTCCSRRGIEKVARLGEDENDTITITNGVGRAP